ncbi:helix-turn-helix domain-containing protein [Fodinibius halophilus]|uniref:Helix-turn-helix transcriptional regulator n=1 Tax=Fodinibius halophilus TaxID=1736908 RepID=A0A6M1TDV7_9BACT|nr:helix-turn-helix transcriptional regulator [Fodinibius halophilus]NGP90201.1 helix-turn-helix transcriptional regulator [Fodinibius halophilus]
MDKQKTKQIREEFKQLESPNARLIDKQMEISSQISRYLQQQGLTQKELAQEADIGESQLSEIMRGEGNPTLKTLVKLEQALDEDIIVTPSFHEKHMSQKGFASFSTKREAKFQARETVVSVVSCGGSWQIKRSANPAKNEISEVNVGQIDEENLVPSYS